MPEFTNIGKRSRQRLRTLTGRSFYGRISVLSESEGRAAGFYTPRRVLNVDPGCKVTAGDVVFSPEGRAMLLAWNGALDHHGTYAVTYKLYDLDQKLSWKRLTVVTDPVTGRAKSNSEAELGPAWMALELLGQETDGLNIPKAKYRLLTNVALQVRDKIDDHLVVHRVERLLGITVAEVS